MCTRALELCSNSSQEGIICWYAIIVLPAYVVLYCSLMWMTIGRHGLAMTSSINW